MSRALATPLTFVLLAAALCREARAADAGEHLFVIERSLNANAVAYDVVTTGGGRLDPGSPLRVYWLMRADGGRARELTTLERAWAYGYDVRSCGARTCTVALRALRSRPIVVELGEAAPRALALIAGREGVLRRVFVTTAPGSPFASVVAIELFGESRDDATPLHERIATR